METTFYDDQSQSGVGVGGGSGGDGGGNGAGATVAAPSKESLKNLKRNMTLDFNSTRPLKKQKVTSLLSSPDLKLLKLASPDLDKLLEQNNGIVTTTPTPTQFIFPKNVTEEQEMYARGFEDALAELHNSDSGLSDVAQIDHTSSGTVVTTTAGGGGSRTGGTIGSFAELMLPTSQSSSATSFLPVHVKEEPQTVPSLSGSPPMSPIDMESQEKIKLERKRQRNRIAASKCRKRKLERIARLEEKVRMLKGENSDLSNVVNKLREQVYQLKQQVVNHANRGCQMMVSSPF